jgi:hypothetical protein
MVGPGADLDADRHLGVIRAVLEVAARQAGAVDPKETGHQLQILMMGAVLSAEGGDGEAAQRARELTELLLKSSR